MIRLQLLARSQRAPTLLDAVGDPHLFGPWFKKRETWQAWRVFLKALFALPMTANEQTLYQLATSRTQPPSAPSQEAWLIVGRRGGKSFIVALIAVFLACFRDYRCHLSPGERGVIMVIATDRKQARVIMRYVTALLEGVPMLAKLLERVDAQSIDLTNSISIEVHVCNFRSVRGYTVVAALLDEVAFWRSEESANPDIEILAALRPAMATIPGALLIGVSSPYARRGVLYEAHRDHYGQNGDGVLVWQADTRTMNPTVPEKIITDAYANDPVSAAAEYGAQFRSDVSTFLEQDWITRATISGRGELPSRPDVNYNAFADPSGGSHDSFTLAIAHAERDEYVLDVTRAVRPPFNPSTVVAEYAKLLKTYGVYRVTGDRYAAQWVVEAFLKEGIGYEHSERSASEIYLEALPMFAQGAIRLLDNRALLTELRQLERRTARAGKDSVDHPPSGHDDLANSACGALVAAAFGAGRIPSDAVIAAYSQNGEQLAGTGMQGFVSAFDQVEANAKELEQHSWSWNPPSIDFGDD
jgi:hypothetical protein